MAGRLNGLLDTSRVAELIQLPSDTLLRHNELKKLTDSLAALKTGAYHFADTSRDIPWRAYKRISENELL